MEAAAAAAEAAPFGLGELPCLLLAAAVACQAAFNQGLLISAKAFPRGMKGGKEGGESILTCQPPSLSLSFVYGEGQCLEMAGGDQERRFGGAGAAGLWCSSWHVQVSWHSQG